MNATLRSKTMILAAAAALTLTLAACGGDTRGDAGDAADDAAGTTTGQPTPSDATTPSTTTTPGAPDVNTTTAPPPSAADVRAQLAEKFDKMGGMDRVNIEADAAGVVTLSGTVKSADRRQTAEDAAAMIPGVVRVKNDIRVED